MPKAELVKDPCGAPDEERERYNQLIEANDQPLTREALEARYGEVMDTQQATEKYIFIGFAAPYVVVRRRLDNATGTLTFSHDPRFYWGFTEDR